jgi:hypothetical protein
MVGKLFLSQTAIDDWVSSEKVDLQGEILRLREGGVGLRLVPAALFRKVAGDGEDRRNLVGRVKDEGAIVALGAESYMTSVLFDDMAYDVEPGFVATPIDEPADGGRGMLEAVRLVAS